MCVCMFFFSCHGVAELRVYACVCFYVFITIIQLCNPLLVKTWVRVYMSIKILVPLVCTLVYYMMKVVRDGHILLSDNTL
jgi:hypothetical protein